MSEEEKIKKLLPVKYHDLVPLLKKAIADKLPPHRPYDYKITLKEGFSPPFGPIYSLSILTRYLGTFSDSYYEARHFENSHSSNIYIESCMQIDDPSSPEVRVLKALTPTSTP